MRRVVSSAITQLAKKIEQELTYPGQIKGDGDSGKAGTWNTPNEGVVYRQRRHGESWAVERLRAVPRLVPQRQVDAVIANGKMWQADSASRRSWLKLFDTGVSSCHDRQSCVLG